ncbi:MAG: SAM-dependent methyltransferase [Gemmatimonadota bacterium]
MHEIAQAIAPESRIVHVDNDPIVLAHARALLTSGPQGATAYIDADLRRPGQILDHPVLRATLDLSQPVAMMLVAILHFIPDEDDPAALVSALLDALPAGSYLAASHVTPEHGPARVGGMARIYQAGGVTGKVRSADEFASLAFAGLPMIDPGLVLVSDWRAGDTGPRPLAAEVSTYGGLAYKP